MHASGPPAPTDAFPSEPSLRENSVVAPNGACACDCIPHGHGIPHGTVSQTARYLHGAVSHTTWYPTLTHRARYPMCVQVQARCEGASPVPVPMRGTRARGAGVDAAPGRARSPGADVAIWTLWPIADPRGSPSMHSPVPSQAKVGPKRSGTRARPNARLGRDECSGVHSAWHEQRDARTVHVVEIDVADFGLHLLD